MVGCFTLNQRCDLLACLYKSTEEQFCHSGIYVSIRIGFCINRCFYLIENLIRKLSYKWSVLVTMLILLSLSNNL